VRDLSRPGKIENRQSAIVNGHERRP